MTNNPNEYGCDVCGDRVIWTRHTQYSGSHYLCRTCAEQESDFGINDYMRDWEYKVYSIPATHRPSSFGALKAM